MSVTSDDFGGPVNLREAEEHDRTGVRLISAGTSAGTITDQVVTFTAPEDLEILALMLRAHLTYTQESQVNVFGLVQLESPSVGLQVSAEDDGQAAFTFGTPRRDDYFTAMLTCQQSAAFEDQTDGTGGLATGQVGTLQLVMDPGRDSVSAPLVLQEGEQIFVHKHQITSVGTTDEQVLQVQLDVFWEEVPEADTEVRQRFPSSGVSV